MRHGPLRTVLWQRVDGPGLEHCRLTASKDGWDLTGEAILSLDGDPARAHYLVRLNPDWTTRSVRVDAWRGSERAPLELNLTVDEGRNWRLERIDHSRHVRRDRREVVSALTGLVDVDLGFTPATNTLPIRRLVPVVGAAIEVTAAWVRFPELTVEPLPQRYVRLDERRYRYESGGGAFVAELAVDDLGLVVRYEAGWERVAESGGADDGEGPSHRAASRP